MPNTGGWNAYQTLPATPVAPLGGTHELFLVFRSAEPNRFDIDSFTWGMCSAGGGGV